MKMYSLPLVYIWRADKYSVFGDFDSKITKVA
jgi:hypothetical protein